MRIDSKGAPSVNAGYDRPAIAARADLLLPLLLSGTIARGVGLTGGTSAMKPLMYALGLLWIAAGIWFFLWLLHLMAPAGPEATSLRLQVMLVSAILISFGVGFTGVAAIIGRLDALKGRGV
jgi:hypothetical protein